MVDLAQFNSVSALAALIMVIIQVVKAVWPEGMTDKQKSWLPLVAIVAGLVLAPAIAGCQGLLRTSADFLSYVMGGFLAGAEAVGIYEATWDKVKTLPFFKPER